MGKPNQESTLVVMTNGDVYYITSKVSQQLLDLVRSETLPSFFRFVDVKSMAYVTVATNKISSIVEGNRNA